MVSYVDLLDDCQLMDVSGMELVLVLRGRLHNGCFEEVFFPSFYSSYEQFHTIFIILGMIIVTLSGWKLCCHCSIAVSHKPFIVQSISLAG